VSSFADEQGLPNNNYFPFDTLEATVALPNRFKPTPNSPVDPPLSPSQYRPKSPRLVADSLSSTHVIVPKTEDSVEITRKIDLKTALQYGTAQGYPPLFTFIRQFTRENLHPNIPYLGGPEVILTCGSTDGFSKSLEALNNIWVEGRDNIGDREGLLVEEFAYMNAIQTARSRGLNIIPVAIDDEGMTAAGKGGLEDVLKTWDESRGKRPHLIYTVT
jgi:DNA-binding transcriptional MocR family regulator